MKITPELKKELIKDLKSLRGFNNLKQAKQLLFSIESAKGMEKIQGVVSVVNNLLGENLEIEIPKSEPKKEEPKNIKELFDEQAKKEPRIYPTTKPKEKLEEDEFSKIRKNKNVMITSVDSSGLLNENVFFQLIFLRGPSVLKPYIFTSEGEFIPVLESKDKKTTIYYFRYGGKYFQLNQRPYITEQLRSKINSVDNNIIDIVENEEYSKDIYNKYFEQIKKYWDHFEKREIDLKIPFCFLSPITRLLNKVFYLIINGREDTGKSTLQRVLSKIQFNGFFCGRGSVPLSVRLTHVLGAHINQDEFEKMKDKDREFFVSVANSGLYADGSYNIVNISKEKIEEQIQIFSTFALRSFSSNDLSSFDRSFLSRCDETIGTKQNRSLKDSLNLTPEEKNKFQRLTNEMVAYVILNCFEIKKDIDEMKKELESKGSFGRKTDTSSMILGIIKHFKGKEYAENIKEYLSLKEGLKREESKGSYDEIILSSVVNKFINQDPIKEISSKELFVELCEELEVSPDDKIERPKIRIGVALKNLGLIGRTPNDTKRKDKGYYYSINRKNLIDILERYGFNELIAKIKVSPVEESVK